MMTWSDPADRDPADPDPADPGRARQSQTPGRARQMFCDSAHGTRVRLNGLLTFFLKFERTQVTLIKFIKSVSFSFFHGCPSVLVAPGIGQYRELYTIMNGFTAA
jgi:hypothetical protein